MAKTRDIVKALKQKGREKLISRSKAANKMTDNKMATVLANPDEFSDEVVAIAQIKYKLKQVADKEGPTPRPEDRRFTSGTDPETGATRGFDPEELRKYGEEQQGITSNPRMRKGGSVGYTQRWANARKKNKK
tara:strand:- start:336 stop:734 length:399 start_codon:yes stop_codon:yes gene_type:complete